MKLTKLSTVFVVLLCCSLSCKKQESPTEPTDSGPIPLGQNIDALTQESGNAILTFNGVDSDYQIDITIGDFDSDAPVANLEVKGTALKGGVFVMTHDPEGNFFPYTHYIPYTDFKETSLSKTGSRVPVVTIVAGVVAVINVGAAIYEYIVDPPGIEEVLNDEGVKHECLTGDLNDVLSLVGGALGVKTLSGVVKVFGAPAKIRGVTAINSGFTKVDLTKEIVIDQVVSLFDQVTGILDQDVRVWCWPVVDDTPIPVFKVDVTREKTQFDIEEIISLAHYPIFPTADDITTELSVKWSGQPKFPVFYSTTPVVCYPGWICYPGSITYSEHANPLKQTFGCFSSNPSSKSGYITYQVQLTDADGLQTPPVTFTFRCGGGDSTLVMSKSSSAPTEAGGTVILKQ